MAKKDIYEAKTEELILPVLRELGIELYDIDYEKEGGEYFLRVYIDKEGGVTIDDCVNVSRAFDVILDREDYISDPYTFEVSSPGLGRPLKKEKDYLRNIGKRIEIKTFQKKDGGKEFSGILTDFADGIVTLMPDEEKPEDVLVFSRKEIALARLAFDF